MINLLTNPKFLPTVQVAISIVACAIYVCHGNLRQAIYWAGSAIIVSSVTY